MDYKSAISKPRCYTKETKQKLMIDKSQGMQFQNYITRNYRKERKYNFKATLLHERNEAKINDW